MKLARHMPRIGSGISYALMLIASLFCFDFEPSSGPEKLVPQEVVMAIDHSEAEAPVPETKRPAALLPFTLLNAQSDQSQSLIFGNDGRHYSKMPLHFDARGPPLALAA